MSMVEVKVPQLSESVAEATLLQWKKNPGDAVALDEVLIEIETDKVVLEVPAPSAGQLAQIVKPDGSTVVSGEVIAIIDAAKADAPGGRAQVVAAPAPRQAASPAPREAATAAPRETANAAAAVAMPAAAKRMADAGLSPSQVTGTWRDGRITKGDVLATLNQPPPVARAADPAPAVPAL